MGRKIMTLYEEGKRNQPKQISIFGRYFASKRIIYLAWNLISPHYA